MIFKLVYKKLGGYAKFDMWAGKTDGCLGKCGEFVLAENEVTPFLNLLRRGEGAGAKVIVEEETSPT